MSTRAEIGRRPIAFSRLLQPGRARAVAHAADRSGRRTAGRPWPRPAGSRAVIAGPARAVAGHRREVARAPAGRGRRRRGRARCRRTPKQSLRSGVSLISITGPFEAQRLGRGVPTSASAGSSMMPSCSSPSFSSRAEQQHADAGHAADHRLLQHLARGRDDRALGREDRLHAGARVGRAADDLEHAVPGLDRAQAQPVGVRVLARPRGHRRR